MSVSTDGTQVAVIATEHTLATITLAGNYLYNVNRRNMLAGDTTELRVYSRVISTDTTDGYVIETLTGAPIVDERVMVSIPFRVEHESKVSLKQTAGTGRSYTWSVWQID